MRWAASVLLATTILALFFLGSASAAPNIQGDTSPTTTAYPIVDQTTCEGPKQGSVLISGSTWKAQTFLPALEGRLTQVELPGVHAGGTTSLHLRDAPGGVPGNLDLASTTLHSGSLFQFEEPVRLIPGRTYALVLSNQGGSFAWDYSDSRTCYGDEAGQPFTSLDSGVTWSVDVVDFFFTTIMLPDEPGGTPLPTQVPTLAPTATPGEAITEASVYVLSLPMSQPQHDPQLWTERLIGWLKEASMYHGYADRTAPPYLEYQIYSGEVVQDQQVPPRLPNGNYDLTAIYARHDLCELVQSDQVDEVWIWDSGGGGFPEWVTVGPDWRAPWPWGAQFNPPDCGRQVTTMVFNYDRELDVALESFSHRLEGLFMHHFPCDFWTESWPWTGWPAECAGLVSDRYGFVGRPFDGNDYVGVCGDAHHPPNILYEPDYDFDNPRAVQSICTDWQMDGSAQAAQVTCQNWGCTHLGYHVWWMQNIPGYENSNHDRNGELMPNWWEYLFGDPTHEIGTPTPTPTSTPTTQPSETPQPTAIPTDTPFPTISPTASLTPPAGRSSLMANVFLDYRCDTFFKPGIDSYLADVPVTLNFANGATWTRPSSGSGLAFFYGFEGAQVLSVAVELPDVYRGEAIRACENSPTFRFLSEDDFRFNREYVVFRAR